ncbi:hypothetical protein AX774_g1548 [Zancudomyces culisetae]|uniref:CCAAT-binding factor domain-containing protein n=1 Tax=Zancudomyces culisetae TaxID=1213189 RepID=A0A1R1PVE1_ZANCU|nr:hypothetical protein AX774_g3530 [Zancudomyces culisetae]OMH84911.1 hypothetical protein AX774_g1548 [Zancudomyces culisetae]|eukprot:OMH82960.1 hypothetical protein AX774_g3530 [Zancudomyces culisetae]
MKVDLDEVDQNSVITDENEQKAVLSAWIVKTYKEFIKNLLSNFEGRDIALKIGSLRILMSLVKKEGAFLCRRSKIYTFPKSLFEKIVEKLIQEPSLEDEGGALENGRKADYDPIKKKSVESTGKNSDLSKKYEDIAQRTFEVLKNIKGIGKTEEIGKLFWIAAPEKSEKKAGVFKSHSHRRMFSEAWLSLMRIPLPVELYKMILMVMHRRILPGMHDPCLLMDFLTESYDSGGPVSLLALNGLFTLITEYNLTYPEFYTKLYAMFDKNLLQVKYRSRFFRLADTFLSSSHLPSYLVAAFIKRLSRISLTASPSALVIVAPFIYNLLKRHPTCMILIHRADSEDSPSSLEKDPYDFNEPDPAKSNALESSLWEILPIQNHYYSNISIMASIFNEPFKSSEYLLEDFLDHTYSTMISAETAKQIKKQPALSDPAPTSFFRSGEVLGDIFSLD